MENKTTLIVGLGNVGEKYSNTRHNVGFLVVDAIARDYSVSFSHKKKMSADVAETSSSSGKLVLVKPTTFMNRSGEAVQKVIAWLKPQEVIVVHDDADLEFGDVRVKESGGSAGHNGINSIIESIGKEFTRVRVGIGRPENDRVPLEDWVLGKWSESEKEKLPEIIKKTIAQIK